VPVTPPTVPLERVGCRVLVADDHAALNDMISDSLRGDGHDVDQASDGRQALEMLRSGVYRAAVIDVRMPGLTGFEVLARAMSDGVKCAVIMISVVADAESRVRAETLGAVGFHQKPFAIELLMRDVRSACSDSAALL
jgi:two-component system, OmpR family, response regulator